MLALHGFLHVLGYDHEADDGDDGPARGAAAPAAAGLRMIVAAGRPDRASSARCPCSWPSVEASFNLLQAPAPQPGRLPRRERASSWRSTTSTTRRASLMPVHLGTYTAHVGMTVIITSLLFRLLDHWAMLAAFGVMMAYLLLFRLSVPYILVRAGPRGARSCGCCPCSTCGRRASSPLIARIRQARRCRSPTRTRTPPGARGAAAAGAARPTRTAWSTRSSRFSETLVRDGDDAAPGHRGDRLGRDGRRPAPADARDQVQPRPGVRQGPRRHPGRRRGARPARLRGRRRRRPSPSSCARSHLVPDTKRIAGAAARDAGPPHHLRGRDRRVRRHRRASSAIEDIVEELVGEIKDEYDVEGDPLAVDAGRQRGGRRARQRRPPRAGARDRAVGRRGDRHRGRPRDRRSSARSRAPASAPRYRGFEVEVLAAERKRVNRVRFRRVPGLEPGVSEPPARTSRSALPLRLRDRRGPPERGQVHARQPPGRPEGRDRLRQAPDDAQPHPRRRQPAGRADRALRHARASTSPSTR